jgi:diguanylate cyclase (GGDEF)-like protein
MITQEDIHRAKILIVDDSRDNVEIFAELLHALSYEEVSVTTSSTEVAALHAANNYDLILLDMHMPELHGLDVMRELKKIEHEAYLPVLAITGDRKFEVQALKEGARDFITKPFDLHQLEARVHNLLEVRLLYKKVREQSRLQQEMATHDALTGLPNRRLLLDRVEKSMQHAYRTHHRIAVMYIDLDGFKAVNDTYGHGHGDQLLKMVAERLCKATRQEDTVCRIGGDEFVVLLPDTSDIEDVKRPAANILEYLSEPFEIENVVVRISASIGIAIHPDDGSGNPATLIARADEALYQAKNTGKNRYFISDVTTANRPGYWM